MTQPYRYHASIIMTVIVIGSLSWTLLSNMLPSSVPFVDQLVQGVATQFDTHPEYHYASAATEASLRCTDGKLANTEDQCPSKDECPPPQNGTVSNCTAGGSSISPSRNSSEINTNDNAKTDLCADDNRFTLHTSECPNSLISSKNNSETSENEQRKIEILTDKENYKTGKEVVNVLVKNNGNQSLVFSDSKSDVVIRSLKGGQTYEPSAVGTLALEPNGTKTFAWNQQDAMGQQVDKGIYSVSISMGASKANTTFNLS